MTLATVILVGFLCCAGLWQHGMLHRRRIQGALDDAIAGRESLQRVARLAGRDLRDAALRLTGQAAVLAFTPSDLRHADPDVSVKLAIVAERCRMLAEDLASAGLPMTGASLREDRLDLLVCAQESVGAVTAALRPGRRSFVLPKAPAHGVCVWADARALRQVLGRVLTEAAFNTRQDDWITLSVEEDDGALVLAVADEGAGTWFGEADATPLAGVRTDSRGIGATLAMSRALIEAHGGRLDVVSAPAAGTRIAIVFPRDRRRA